jgi:hypothetical protein
VVLDSELTIILTAVCAVRLVPRMSVIGSKLMPRRTRKNQEARLREPMRELELGWIGSCRDRQEMGNARIALAVVACLTTFTGCASSTSVGEVKDIGQGNYRISVGRSSILSHGTEASNAAVDKAGEYCHSKGQKVEILLSPGNDVTFHCVSERSR